MDLDKGVVAPLLSRFQPIEMSSYILTLLSRPLFTFRPCVL
jgi:hypothetical protein